MLPTVNDLRFELTLFMSYFSEPRPFLISGKTLAEVSDYFTNTCCVLSRKKRKETGKEFNVTNVQYLELLEIEKKKKINTCVCKKNRNKTQKNQLLQSANKSRLTYKVH